MLQGTRIVEYLLYGFGIGGFGWWWQATVWVLLFPAITLFAWYDYKWMRRTVRDWRFLTHARCAKFTALKNLRNRMYANLNKVLH